MNSPVTPPTDLIFKCSPALSTRIHLPSLPSLPPFLEVLGSSSRNRRRSYRNPQAKAMTNSAKIPNDINDDKLALRKAEEAASRRFQAAEWLREMDKGAYASLPEEPSEEEFCLPLRNGLILCNVLNKVKPGAVSKVVETSTFTVQETDGAAQSAIQYFENMKNFLDAVAEMKLLTFEASDLEKGGSSVKVVDCILCLKGYHEWKLAGGIGIWRYAGIVKITSSSKGWPSPLLGGENADDASNSSSIQNQQLLEVIQLLAEVSLGESKAANGLSFLFDRFGFRLLHAFLTEWNEADNLPLSPMIINMMLEQAVKEFYMLLVSQRNQLGLLFKKMMMDGNHMTSKAEFVQTIRRRLEDTNCDSCSCSKHCLCGEAPKVNTNKRVDLQQRQLEKLKLSFNEMKDQVQCIRTKWEEDLKKLEQHTQCCKLNTTSYYKLLEENRLLYNQIQDLKGNIRVYCRVRPFLTKQFDGKSTIDHIGGNGSIMIMNPHKQGKDARKIFSFNKVFEANTTQFEVFADTQPLIRSVMDGYNVCIFAYGQTGSGKTYTMSGPDLTAEETWGVNYRALSDLFHISRSRTDVIKYDVSIQMIEIYNEQVRDLLVSDGSNRRLEIRNNSQLHGLNIPDASLVSVNCTEDVLNLMKIGLGNRAVGATALNERSSRSHSVLTVHVHGKEMVSGSILRGCLHLVDLAGSERVDKSEATGERLKEAQHINRSLSALGDVIFALAQRHSHIPYRNSKLTQVLQDALGGQAKTLMFVHISPEVSSFGETMSTLKFAERVASVELGAARANKEAGEVREIKDELSKLKATLETKESEVAQLRDYASRIALELENLKTMPLQKNCCSMNLKHEVSRQPTLNARPFESRSNSSGKQRKPRFPSVLADKEQCPKSPLSAGENYIRTRKLRSPSPPVKRSLSTDHATFVKTKPKIQTVEERPIRRLQFLEKASVNGSINIPTVFLTGDSRKIFSEHDEGQFHSALDIRKFTTENKKSDIGIGKKLEARKRSDFSEIENKCSLIESPLNDSLMLKKSQHHVTRIQQQNMEPSIQAVDPLSRRKQENKPQNAAGHNGKEGSRTIVPEIRRSRSLPRGKLRTL